MKMPTIPSHNSNAMKTTPRFHLTPIRIATIMNTQTTIVGENVEEKGTLILCWWECKLV
jgi:hypothetical protein